MTPSPDRQRRAPRASATWLLFLLLILVGGLQLLSFGEGPDAGESWVERLGLASGRQADLGDRLADDGFSAGVLGELILPYLTYPFLAGSLLLLLCNLGFLSLFGPPTERRVGLPLQLLLFLLGGAVAGLVHGLLTTDQLAVQVVRVGEELETRFASSASVPVVGSSGAVAAILGAHFILLPGSRFLCWVPASFRFSTPTVIFLVTWFVLQATALEEAGTLVREVPFAAVVAAFGSGMLVAVSAMAIGPERFVPIAEGGGASVEQCVEKLA